MQQDSTDVNEVDAYPTLSNGWDKPTSWGVGAEDREKVFALYREARPVAAKVLKLRKELAQIHEERDKMRAEVKAYNDELDVDDDEVAEINWVEREGKINKLVSQITRLEQQSTTLLSEIISCDRRLTEQSKRVSMLLCPPRAYDVMAGLPPLELRDQVYSYLWDEQAVHRVESQIGDVTNELSELHLSKDWTLQVPHFADANYVDEPFAREAATLFFRVITALEVQYRSVRRFLKMSSFGNMSLCPRDIIRRLVIDVKFAPVGRSYRRIIVLADLRDNLESLLTLPVRDNFEIIIYIDREIQFSRTLFKTLEIMKPIYHALVQKGMKIKVLGFQFFTPAWRNPDDIREEATVGRPCTTAEQLNYYFEMTPMEWLDMKEGELNAIKQPLRRERCMRILDNMREFVGEMESWADDPEMGELLAKLTLKMSAFDTGVQRV